jgi:hypothetical protein
VVHDAAKARPTALFDVCLLDLLESSQSAMNVKGKPLIWNDQD